MKKEYIFRLLAYGLMVAFFLRVLAYNLIREIINHIRLRRHGVHSTGRIIEIKKSEDLDGLKSFYPVIEYFFNDKIYHLSPKDERTLSQPEIGREISIIHDKSNPEKAILNTKGAKLNIFLKVFFVLVVIGILSAAIFSVI